jgi:hypothetical protein
VNTYISKPPEKDSEIKYLKSYNEEKIQQYTRTADTSNPIFGDILSL